MESNQNQIVVVEGTQLEKIEYMGQAVVSLPMVDAVHQFQHEYARRNFNRNRERFVVNEDYFIVPHEEWSSFYRVLKTRSKGVKTRSKGGRRGDMIFLTLSGYLMLAKTFTDDLSWQVQRMLVKSYFAATQTISDLKDELIDTQRRLILALSRKQNKISADEVKTMVAYRQEGLTTAEIRDRTGRSPSSIRAHIGRARQLGLFDDQALKGGAA